MFLAIDEDAMSNLALEAETTRSVGRRQSAVGLEPTRRSRTRLPVAEFLPKNLVLVHLFKEQILVCSRHVHPIFGIWSCLDLVVLRPKTHT